MSEANKTQVAGTHYQQPIGIPQHWDLATQYKWDPFQYQITKYVMRWKDKHKTHAERVQDLKKARHFLDKYIEEAEKWDDHKEKDPTPVASGATVLYPSTFTVEGYYGDETNLYQCKKCRTLFRLPLSNLDPVWQHHSRGCASDQSKGSGTDSDGAATSAYTNQG